MGVLSCTTTQYGDSYTEDITEESLREVFRKMEEKVSPSHSHHTVMDPPFFSDSLPPPLDQGGEGTRISQEEMALVESRYFPDDSPRGLFRQAR